MTLLYRSSGKKMPSSLYAYVFVAVGGAVGAIARFALHNWLQKASIFPWGTLSANLAGCLVMGVIAELAANASWFNTGGVIPDQHRLLFAVGFCGSFTTLSAMVLEVSALLQRNDILTAFAYLSGTLIGGFAFFYLGIRLVRLFMAGTAIH